jgi:Gas vesicle synthesis protein GvpL/GvpF
MIYLYALTETEPRGFRNLGLDGEPVCSLTTCGFNVVHSSHAPDFDPAVTPTMLWTHEAIVDELLEAGAVLPFRFGTMLPDRDAVAAAVARRADQFRRTFAELRDRVELAVRVGVPKVDDSAPRDGSEYLAVRARARLAQDEVADAVLTPLDALAAASRRRDPDRARVIRASYLVSRDDVPRFASTVRGLQQQHPELAVSCTGPWAPYSFVGEAPS